MSPAPISIGAQDHTARAKFENEVKRIIETGNRAGVLWRLLGSLAFHEHCPQMGYLQAELGRAYTDIDRAAYQSQAKEIKLKIHPTASRREAANLMIQHHPHRLVVIDPVQPETIPLGVISSYDIVAEMARADSVWQQGK